jgi:hypothetical protein
MTRMKKMMMMMKQMMMMVGVALLASACDRSTGSNVSGSATGKATETWIRGDVDERFALVAKHLRGFDLAMVETGYRHGELYWAGSDQNWDYATYQLEKIETAVAHGIERRPKRAPSAAMLAPSITRVRGAVEHRDGAGFAEAFTELTQTCNACHVAEKVPFIQVVVPSQRVSPVGNRVNPTEAGGTP